MARCVRTRTHVKRRSAAEIGAALTTGRQPEVGEVDVLEVVRAEDVLRLQVTVVHALRMARLDGVQDLQEGALHGGSVVHESVGLHDRGEEVATGAEIEDNERVELFLNDCVKLDNIRKVRNEGMVPELTILEASLV